MAGVLMLLSFVLLGSSAEKQEADKQARLDRGEVVIEVLARGMDPQVGSGMVVVLVAGAAGLVGFLGTFLALGGRLSAEHRQGLADMMRR